MASLVGGAFLNRFVIPHLHEFLAKRLGHDDARAALLSESFRGLPDYASGTPARSKRHPFSKVIGIQPAAVIQQWRQAPANALVRSCHYVNRARTQSYSKPSTSRWVERHPLRRRSRLVSTRPSSIAPCHLFPRANDIACGTTTTLVYLRTMPPWAPHCRRRGTRSTKQSGGRGFGTAQTST